MSENSIFYKNGWGNHKVEFNELSSSAEQLPEKNQLLDLLKQQFQKDCKYQRTHIGPHRADLQIRIGRHDVKDLYSRGQKKTTVAAMKLAQAKVVKNISNKQPILLLDDLPSELDDVHLARFIQYIVGEGYQSFITSVDERIYRNNSEVKARMFEVERGKIIISQSAINSGQATEKQQEKHPHE